MRKKNCPEVIIPTAFPMCLNKQIRDSEEGNIMFYCCLFVVVFGLFLSVNIALYAVRLSRNWSTGF